MEKRWLYSHSHSDHISGWTLRISYITLGKTGVTDLKVRKKKTFTFFLIISNSMQNWTTFVKEASFYAMLSLESCLQFKIVFHQRLSSIKSLGPSKGLFHQRSSSVKACLPSMVVIHNRSYPVKCHLSSNVVICQRESSIKGYLPSKVVFHLRSSSIKGCLPSN